MYFPDDRLDPQSIDLQRDWQIQGWFAGIICGLNYMEVTQANTAGTTFANRSALKLHLDEFLHGSFSAVKLCRNWWEIGKGLSLAAEHMHCLQMIG